jgi:hypothetical protein
MGLAILSLQYRCNVNERVYVKDYLLGEGSPGSGFIYQSVTLIKLLHQAQCSLACVVRWSITTGMLQVSAYNCEGVSSLVLASWLWFLSSVLIRHKLAFHFFFYWRYNP